MTITREEAIARIEGVLKAAGIKLSTGSFGCCGGTYADVEFPDGAKGENLEGFDIDCDGLSHQAG